MTTFVLDLRIGADEWIRYYSGTVKHVVARTRDGRRVQFAAKHLQRHVTRDGISGTFRLDIDDRNNFVALERVEI